MAESIKCVKCGKRTATVKIIRILGGKAQSVFLCEQCAAQVSPYQQPFSLQEAIEKALAQLVQKQSEDEEAQGDATVGPECPECGTTLAVYRKSFRLGCPQCYSTFEEILEPQLRRYHGSTRHVGRTPKATSPPLREIGLIMADLKKDLSQAILNENFERAIELRDRIRSLEGESNHACPEMPEM